jgi:hypothetical protein
MLMHLVVPIQVLVQNLHNAPPALDPDPCACLAALQIIKPGLKFIHGYVYLLISPNRCIDGAHAHYLWKSASRIIIVP